MQRRPSGFDSEDGPVEAGAGPVASDLLEPELVRESGGSVAPSVQACRLVRLAAASAATGDRVAAGVAAGAGLAVAVPAAAVRPLTAELPWDSAVACPAWVEHSSPCVVLGYGPPFAGCARPVAARPAAAEPAAALPVVGPGPGLLPVAEGLAAGP